MYGHAEKVGDTLIMSKGEVESSNKNIFDVDKATLNNSFSDDGSSYSDSKSDISDFMSVVSGNKYTLSYTRNDAYTYTRVIGFDSNKNLVASPLILKITDVSIGDKTHSFEIPSNVKYIRFNYSKWHTNIQLEKGESATSYIKGEQSSISAYDIIGNYLLSVGSDVKDELCVNADGTGTRIPRFGLLDLGTVTWSASGVQSDGTYRYNGTAIPTKSGALGLCSAFDYNVGSHVSGADDIIIHQSSLYPIVYSKTVYADANAFKTAMSGQYLIYELATVTPQSLSASQVQSLLALQTFKSHTDIVADCTVDVTYYKDNQNGQSVADVDARLNRYINGADNILEGADMSCTSNISYKDISVSPNTKYTLSTVLGNTFNGSYAYVLFSSTSISSASGLTDANSVYKYHPVTVTSDASGKVRVWLRKDNNNTPNADNTKLVIGEYEVRSNAQLTEDINYIMSNLVASTSES